MQISVLAHTFSNDLRSALEAARRADFRGVVLDPTVYGSIVDSSQTARREIMALLSRHEQPLIAIDVRLSPAGFSPRADLEKELDRLRRAMDVARGLQGALVLADLGPLPPAPHEPTPVQTIDPGLLGRLILPETVPPKPVSTLPRDEAFESSLEIALRELGTRCDRASCRIAFRSSLGSFASLHHALSRVDCPWFCVDLDPLLMLADEWQPDEVFSRLGRQIAHVRARDALKGTGNRVTPATIGQGAVNWRELHALLRDADYQGAITIDSIDLANRSASAVAGLASLRDLK
jgi:sugar phosphate isomerase/epimerase